MNLLDKSLWIPTLFANRLMADLAKNHLLDHFRWECTIVVDDDGYYIVRLPDSLKPEEFCLGQSFLLAYAHGFSDRGMPNFRDI